MSQSLLLQGMTSSYHATEPAIAASNLVGSAKPDPSVGLGQDDYVHLYRGGERSWTDAPVVHQQDSAVPEELKHGNISLKILNVTSADTGIRWFHPKLNETCSHFKTRTTETPSYPGDLQTPDPETERTMKT
ncbi:hypothetical protein INR49_010779 [Caranx melampygus]|nr:hypothetical protein INR49_010779 [Caranx melampygus]